MSISDSQQEIPSDEELIDQLSVSFDDDETDWFKRLAWLIECQIRIKAVNKSADEFDIVIEKLKKGLIGGQVASRLQDYYESTCDPQFPANFIKNFIPSFIHRICQIIRTRGVLRHISEQSEAKLIEDWLEKYPEGPEWIHEVPQRGLFQIIKKCRLDIKDINDKDDIRITHGAVMEGFNACEIVFSQLVSFYGRFLFCVFDRSYREKLLKEYDSAAMQYSEKAWEERLPKLEDEYRKLDNIKEIDNKANMKQFVEYVLSAGFPKDYSTLPVAYDLRRWEKEQKKEQKEEPNFKFSAWIELLKQLDKWIKSDAFCELDRFEKIFGRRQLFLTEATEEKSKIKVIKFFDNELKLDYIETKRTSEPRIIQEFKSLNEVRQYYAHNRSPKFCSDINKGNYLESSVKTLTALAKLLEHLQGNVFPNVIVPKRLLQVESDWLRLDYVGEDDLDHLRHIRIDNSALDYLADLGGPAALLNQETYFVNRKSSGWLAESLYILPIEEKVDGDKQGSD